MKYLSITAMTIAIVTASMLSRQGRRWWTCLSAFALTGRNSVASGGAGATPAAFPARRDAGLDAGARRVWSGADVQAIALRPAPVRGDALAPLLRAARLPAPVGQDGRGA